MFLEIEWQSSETNRFKKGLQRASGMPVLKNTQLDLSNPSSWSRQEIDMILRDRHTSKNRNINLVTQHVEDD